jgi:hypothetical protein
VDHVRPPRGQAGRPGEGRGGAQDRRHDGLRTINEGRKLIKLPRIDHPDADRPLIPVNNMIFLGDSPKRTPAGERRRPPGAERPAGAIERAIVRAGNLAYRRLKAGDEDHAFNAERFERELAHDLDRRRQQRLLRTPGPCVGRRRRGPGRRRRRRPRRAAHQLRRAHPRGGHDEPETALAYARAEMSCRSAAWALHERTLAALLSVAAGDLGVEELPDEPARRPSAPRSRPRPAGSRCSRSAA